MNSLCRFKRPIPALQVAITSLNVPNLSQPENKTKENITHPTIRSKAPQNSTIHTDTGKKSQNDYPAQNFLLSPESATHRKRPDAQGFFQGGLG